MKNKILSILTESKEYVSGEILSSECGISRTAIWKHIKTLKATGYEIESYQGLGYRLVSRPDELTEVEISSALQTKLFGQGNRLFSYKEVSSTNIIAKEKANQLFDEGIVVVADQQLQGKGRLGRNWVSPPGTGIWMSIVLRPDIMPKDATHLTFVAAVAVAEAIRNQTELEVKIKWPNDIVVNGKKICGILTEIVAEIERLEFMVMGIGINANQGNKDFSRELQHKASSLALELGYPVSRVKILQEVLKQLERYYFLYLEKGFNPIKEQWLINSNTINQQVKIIERGEFVKEGQVVGMDDDGALLLRTVEGVERIIVGDVSVRNSNGEYC